MGGRLVRGDPEGTEGTEGADGEAACSVPPVCGDSEVHPKKNAGAKSAAVSRCTLRRLRFEASFGAQERLP